MNPIPVFWTEDTGRDRRYLRRHVKGECPLCPGEYSHHDIMVPLDVVTAEIVDGNRYREHIDIPHDDPRWPTHCACGYAFESSDQWDIFSNSIYRAIETDQEWPLRDLPPGAMYDATWYPNDPSDWHWRTPDGIHLCIIGVDGHPFMPDLQASNCTRRDDIAHYCWVRHGDPRDPQGKNTGTKLHIDKAGNTCAAGAGSFFSLDGKSWHGFLDHGLLTKSRA